MKMKNEYSTACNCCTYANCKNSRRTTPHLHFFSYPFQDIPRLKEWVKNTGNYKIYELCEKTQRSLQSVLHNKCVCENHFAEKDFRRSTAPKKRLNPNAVPIKFEFGSPPPSPEHLRLRRSNRPKTYGCWRDEAAPEVDLKKLAEAQANGSQPPAKFQKVEGPGPFSEAGPSGAAGPSGLYPAVAGPSKLHLPRPLPSDTDQFVCKVENEEDDFGEKYDSGTTVYEPAPSTSFPNPASMLVHEPARLPDGTLMVPLPVMDPTAIKQEFDEDGKVIPLYVDPNDPLLPRKPRAPTPVPVHKPHEITGHRIVDLGYLIQWTMELTKEHFRVCPDTDLKVINEIHDGLRSDIVFHCDKCGFETVKSTMNPETSPPVLRKFYQWKNSLKRSTWLFAQQWLKIFSIPFK